MFKAKEAKLIWEAADKIADILETKYGIKIIADDATMIYNCGCIEIGRADKIQLDAIEWPPNERDGYLLAHAALANRYLELNTEV